MTDGLRENRIAKLNKRWKDESAWWWNSRWTYHYRLPTDDERLMTSPVEGCLTHIVRHVSDVVDAEGRGDRSWQSFQAWCGQSYRTPRVELVPLEGEFFACHQCILRAELHQCDTFKLVPSTGCEMSEGRRWRRRDMRNPQDPGL